MKQKKGFILYLDQGDLFESLEDSAAGRVIKAVFAYQKSGTIPKLDPAAKMLFMVICTQLDRDNERWARTVERRAEAGRAGGRARAENAQANEANASKSKQTKQMLANQADRERDRDRDKERDSDRERESDSDSDSAGGPGAEEAPPAPDTTPTPDNTLKKPRGTHEKVMLTDAEYERIQTIRPKDWEAKIDYFDWYLNSHPDKHYDDHFKTILDWAEMDDLKKPKQNPDTSVHFDLEEVNKGKYSDIFFDIFSPEADEYLKNGTWPYRKETENDVFGDKEE